MPYPAGDTISPSATFTVEKNSTRIEVPDSFTLHRSALKADATAAPAPSQASSGGALNRKTSKSPRQSVEQTDGGVRPAGDGAPLNTLRVTLHPAGAGTYASKVVLTSGGDVRVLDLEFVAVKAGQQVTLEFAGPARDKLMQEVSQPSYSHPCVTPQHAGLHINQMQDMLHCARATRWTVTLLTESMCLASTSLLQRA